jgi:hypothetical protein
MIINNFYCTPQCSETAPLIQPQMPGKNPKNPKRNQKSQERSRYTPSYNIPPSTPSNQPCVDEPCEEDYSNKIEMW